MDNEEKEIYIDSSKVIVVYASPSYERESRVSVTDNLGQGKPSFHVAGYSYQRSTSLEILVRHDSEMLAYLDEKTFKNERIKITSTFSNIPSAEYYITKFSVKYHDKDYVNCTLDLILFNGEAITEFIGNKKKKTTSQAINSDKKSVEKVTQTKKVKTGESEKYTVKQIQKALRRQGYYLREGTHKLLIDGVYGKYTKKAVQQFQKAKGLKVTGVVDKDTAKKLKL